MNYVLSHIGTIIVACVIVAVAAVLWWYLLDKNARLKRERAQARMNAARKAKESNENNEQ